MFYKTDDPEATRHLDGSGSRRGYTCPMHSLLLCEDIFNSIGTILVFAGALL